MGRQDETIDFSEYRKKQAKHCQTKKKQEVRQSQHPVMPPSAPVASNGALSVRVIDTNRAKRQEAFMSMPPVSVQGAILSVMHQQAPPKKEKMNSCVLKEKKKKEKTHVSIYVPRADNTSVKNLFLPVF